MSLLYDPQLETYTGAFEDYRGIVNAKVLRLGIVITFAFQVPFLPFDRMLVFRQATLRHRVS